MRARLPFNLRRERAESRQWQPGLLRTVLEFRLTALAGHRSPGHGLGGALFGHGEQHDQLLLGVEYADGRTGSNLSGFRVGLDLQLDPSTPILMPGGGGGGERSADVSYYLSPLPPPGPLRIITAWPSRGVAETVTEVPAGPLIEAATRVRVLWLSSRGTSTCATAATTRATR